MCADSADPNLFIACYRKISWNVPSDFECLGEGFDQFGGGINRGIFFSVTTSVESAESERKCVPRKGRVFIAKDAWVFRNCFGDLFCVSSF